MASVRGRSERRARSPACDIPRRESHGHSLSSSPLVGRQPAASSGGDNAMHAVGREEAIVDALPQAVLVDRVAEIAIGVALLSSRSGVAVMPI